jgi:hypothetical protein
MVVSRLNNEIVYQEITGIFENEFDTFDMNRNYYVLEVYNILKKCGITYN